MENPHSCLFQLLQAALISWFGALRISKTSRVASSNPSQTFISCLPLPPTGSPVIMLYPHAKSSDLPPSRGLINHLNPLCHVSYHSHVFCGLGCVHFGGAIILPTVSMKCQMQFGALRTQLCIDTDLVLRSSRARKEADDCPHRTRPWEKPVLTTLAHYPGQGHEGSSFQCCRVRGGVMYWRELSEHLAFTTTSTWGWGGTASSP